MGIVDWLRARFPRAKSPGSSVERPDEVTPVGLRRTVFVRCLDTGLVVQAIREYGEMAGPIQSLAPRAHEMMVYTPDQGWMAVVVPADLPTYHFLNLVSWLTDAAGGDKERAFGGSVGWSHAHGAGPEWNLACQADPRRDGSVIVGVLDDGKWFATDLSTASPRQDVTPLLVLGTSDPVGAFLRDKAIPERLWGNPGYWAYLVEIERVPLA